MRRRQLGLFIDQQMTLLSVTCRSIALTMVRRNGRQKHMQKRAAIHFQYQAKLILTTYCPIENALNC